MVDKSDAPREKRFLLARGEAHALEWIARRLPARVMPDHLTALGVVAAIAIAVAYVLSNESPLWLWAASALLVVHWLGDSLDGTLARVRGTQRPKYGYYLDHLVDAIATAVIGIGLGLSPHMLLATGLVIGVVSLGYGRVGPTEARLALIGLNTVMALGAGLSFDLFGVGITALDVVGLGLSALALLVLGARARRNLRVLAEREPAGVAA